MSRHKYQNICHHDPLDEAKEIEMLERQRVLDNHRNRRRVNEPEIIDSKGVYHCIDCDDEIPAKRVQSCQKSGDTASYCVPCKEVKESKQNG